MLAPEHMAKIQRLYDNTPRIDFEGASQDVGFTYEPKDYFFDGMFDRMGDAKTNVILYTGHSNLGGNISEELRKGNDEKGSKLVLMAMCRGKQNMFEVANKYPNAQFITTNSPSVIAAT